MKNYILLFFAVIGSSLLLFSCNVDSVDNVTPIQSSDGNIINVTGVYRHKDDNPATPIVNPLNSGNPVTQLDLRQNGNNLEAIDNNNKIFRGTIGSVSGGNTASFNMQGQTTAGRNVSISGNIKVSGDEGEMNGTWIEPDYYATISASAIGPSTFSNVTTLSISPGSDGQLKTGESKTLTANVKNSTGGTITWTSDPSGLINPGSGTGSKFEFTASSATGSVKITASLGTVSDFVTYSINPGGSGGSTDIADVDISFSGNLTMTNNETKVFTATGGNGTSYNWKLSKPEIGQPDNQTGKTLQYKATAAGTQTITVVSGGKSDDVIVTQNN